MPDKAVLVALYPDLEVKEETIGDDRVVVFIVDVSGSMDGEKMKNVKDALRVSLDDIKRRSDSAMKKFERSNFYFNIIAFSSDYNALFDSPVLADQANYDTAMKFVESLAANGGTELYEPLKYVLERSVNDKTKQNVIVITDGEISDTGMYTQWFLKLSLTACRSYYCHGWRRKAQEIQSCVRCRHRPRREPLGMIDFHVFIPILTIATVVG